MERQKHGFDFENNMISVYNLIKSNKYTARWDAFLGDIPVSIKTEKLGSDIELADYFRNSEITEDFILIVGFWDKEKSNVVEIHSLYFPKEVFSSFFDKSFDLKFRQLLNNITNDRKDDSLWKESIKTLKAQWQKATPNVVRPRFKRDHKNQKRIQCAINNKDFYGLISKYSINLMEEKWQKKQKVLEEKKI